MSAVYEVAALSVAFGAHRVVEQVGFAIEAGECVALAGASGSGKSQCCLAPFGLSPGRAHGSARLLGEELIGVGERRLRGLRGRHVGFVFQQPLTALTPHLTVGQQLSEAWRQADGGRPGRRDLGAALERVGLDRAEERLDQFPHRLSGGQRQRVMIAAAIAHRPKLLIADEPTTALDAAIRADILALLSRLRAEQGLAMLLVSHDLPAIAAHADRVIVMKDGRIEEAGSAEQILSHPARPYSRALIAASPRLSSPAPMLPPTGEMLLEARDIGVSFPRPGWRRGRIAAVADASLTVGRGEAVALIGGSGSGKSTLARAIARLGPVDRGTVHWRGTMLPERRAMPRSARAAIQPVFQDPVASVDPLWSVGDIIAEPLRHLRPEMYAAARAARIVSVMEEVGLDSGFATRRPSTLSGGQAQRVAIARALISDPEMLLLDEATSALDVLVAGRVLDLLEGLQRSRGLALLFITHDLAVARRLCHRIIVLDQGRIVEQGATERIIAEPAHPATRRLVQASH
jgi:ABC-type glutathione transport system ATPase component